MDRLGTWLGCLILGSLWLWLLAINALDGLIGARPWGAGVASRIWETTAWLVDLAIGVDDPEDDDEDEKPTTPASQSPKIAAAPDLAGPSPHPMLATIAAVGESVAAAKTSLPTADFVMVATVAGADHLVIVPSNGQSPAAAAHMLREAADTIAGCAWHPAHARRHRKRAAAYAAN